MTNKDEKIIVIIGALTTAVSAASCYFINKLCAVIALISGAVLTALFFYSVKKKNERINELNNYLTLICAGNFDLDISDNTEGELSILKNNIYKVMNILKTQNERLESDKTYLADSLADISHQLKTPLTSMTLMTDLLKDESDSLKRAEFLKITKSQLDKMKWLVTNLLKISKLDSGVTELKLSEISVKSVLSESLRPFSAKIDVMGINVIDNTDDFIFKADADWTGEAVKNIIKNCLEHMERNGKLRFYTVQTNVYNSLFIEDNGCGIAKEDLPHIFERFKKGKNSSPESVGIGLSLAKTVIEKEKGEIFVESEENAGTSFELRFYKSII